MITWVDGLRIIATRLREEEIAAVQSEMYSTWYSPGDVEKYYLEFNQAALRDVPVEELQTVGSLAVRAVTAAADYVLPLDTVKILAVTLKFTGDAKQLPAQYVVPESWLQLLTVNNRTMFTRYSVISGLLKLTADVESAEIITLVEPKLSDFQSDTWILPREAWAMYALNGTHNMLRALDHLPAGKI